MTDLKTKLLEADGGTREWFPAKGIAGRRPPANRPIDVCIDIRGVDVVGAENFAVLSNLYVAFTPRHKPNALLRRHDTYNEILGWSFDRVIGWRSALEGEE